MTLSEVSDAVWPKELAVSFAVELALSAVSDALLADSCVADSALFSAMTSWSFCLASPLAASASVPSLSALAAFSEPWRYVPAFSSTVPI